MNRIRIVVQNTWSIVSLMTLVWLLSGSVVSSASADTTSGAAPEQQTLLATITWDGQGSDNNWSTPENWTGDTKPTSTDIVVFNSTSTKDVTIDEAVTVAGFTVESSYTGTITGGAALIDIDGSFSLLGGTFISTSDEMQITGNFSHTGGTFTHSNGTVRLNGHSGTQTISGTTTFYDLRLDNSSATTDLGTSSITIANDFRADAGTMDAGTSTVTFTGSAGSIAGNNTKRFYDLVISNGANISHTTGGNVEIFHDFTNNGVLQSTKTVTFREPGSDSITHALAGGGDTSFAKMVIQGSNTVNAGSHDFALTSDFSVTGTFNGDSATVTFDGTTRLEGSGDHNFNNFTVNNGGTVVFPATNVPTVAGTLTNNGTLQQTQALNDNSTVSFLNITDGSGTDKYFGVDITPSSNLGDTTVAVSGNQVCAQANGNPVRRCYEITPTTAASADVKFYFQNAELRTGQSLSSLNVWHYNGSTWDQQTKGDTGTASSGVGANCGSGAIDCFVEGTGITTYSPFALQNNDPLAVSIKSLTAEVEDNYVTVAWETTNELANLGFNLYRAASPAGQRTQLNTTLIPSRAPGSSQGFTYTYRDDTAQRGLTYWYWLEDVELSGLRTLHGPVEATLPPYRVYLPFVKGQR